MSRTLLLWAEWLLLAAALAAITITETYTWYITVGLFCLAGSFGSRVLRTRHLAPLTGLEIPGLLFLFSAGIAAWIAYDPSVALLQFARILAAAVLYYTVIDSTLLPNTPNRSYRIVRIVASVLALAAAGLAIYWPLLHDFNAEPSKFSFINTFMGQIKSFLPGLPGPFIHSNVAGGALAAAAPVAMFLVWEFWRLRQRWLAALAGILTLTILIGLVTTGSRGGLLGLGVATGLAGLAWAQRRWFAKPKAKAVYWGIATIGVILLAGGMIASGKLEGLLGLIPDPTGSLQSRPQIWSQGLWLARDYFFTGSGLMSFFYNYPVYALLTVVPVYYHIHNLLLEVLIEQGIVGVIAMLWGAVVILVWGWNALDAHLRRPVPILAAQKPFDDGYNPDQEDIHHAPAMLASATVLGWGGLLAILVVSVHGMVDTVFYAWRLLPLLGLISSLAFLAVPVERLQADRQRVVFRRSLAALGIFGAAMLLGVLFFRPLASAWHANLGAVLQARAELSIFSKTDFQQNTLDQVRRSIDLQPAMSQYERSLQANPGNLTSLHRLTDLYLSLGRYEQASQTIQAAWDAGHRDRMTRLLLADSLVAAGQVEEAGAALLELPRQAISLAEGRLLYQAWYRYTIHQDFQRAANSWQAVLLLNPDNSQAQRGLEEARRQIHQ